jgi:hypothetical protein
MKVHRFHVRTARARFLLLTLFQFWLPLLKFWYQA